MATIIPLRGLRYDQTKAGNIKDLVTPPYDVIDAAAQEEYYNRNPYNIIRLEYGKKFNEDNETNNRYTRAAEFFNQWQCEGVLRPEKDPAVYLYRQKFTVENKSLVRTGIICGVKLEPYENGVVLPHEETMPKHKADRLALMRACGANFSPIFGLYSDRERKVDVLLDEAVENSPPAVSFIDEFGHEHLLWVVDDPQVVRQVQQLMAAQRIFIADGHHRYETALNYARENPDNPAAGYVMMTLVNLFDPGLVILPTHRLIVHSAIEVQTLPSVLQEDFQVEKTGETGVDGIAGLLAELAGLDEQAGTKRRQVFGLYLGGGDLYTVALRDQKVINEKMPADHSAAWRQLDVSVLQKLILENFLGIDDKALAGGEIVRYTRDAREAVRAVDEGRCRAAFLMNPTLIAEVMEVAGNGEKMPQKSTFFYPKLITGLVINKC
jgi:uncharacterized protein (DUF1015 family)